MSANIDRVAFTGDILRVAGNGTPSQWININWLETALRPALLRATKLECFKVEWLINETDFNAATVYEHIGLPLTPDSWATIYYMEPPEVVAEYISSFYRRSLVVGFELSVFLKKCLRMHNIPYIDMRMHPARYMSDLAFYLSTNSKAIRDKLLAFEMMEDTLHEEASMLGGVVRVARYRPPRRDRRALICMQTRFDAVLIDGGSFVSWASYLSELQAISEDYDEVLVKPHPLEAHGHEISIVMDGTRGLRLTSKNFYKLIAEREIDSVYSLSSGTSIEAKLFGIRGEHLFRNYYIHEPSCLGEQDGRLIPMYQDFYSVNFWRNVLSDVVPTTPSTAALNTFIPNRTRRGLGAEKGFLEAFA